MIITQKNTFPGADDDPYVSGMRYSLELFNSVYV